jgi:Xaa-Pro aminopeptidase
MAITIEPGVYIEGWGGIRIEDTVLVTPGKCEILTPTTKELREIRPYCIPISNVLYLWQSNR